jgi:hypothetical protein
MPFYDSLLLLNKSLNNLGYYYYYDYYYCDYDYYDYDYYDY